MHVLDLIYCSFQFFLSPQDLPRALESVLQLAPPSKRSRKHTAQSTCINHRKNSGTTSNQPGLFQLLQCLPWQCSAWRKVGQLLAGRGRLAGAPDPVAEPALGGSSRDRDPRDGWRDGHSFSSVPSVTHPS